MQSTPVQTGDWLSQYSDEPDKVREFCVRHGVLDLVRTTIELAERNFPPIEKITVTLYKTLADEAVRPRIVVEVRSGVEDARAGYWRFIGAVGTAMPYSEWDKIFFSYTIV